MKKIVLSLSVFFYVSLLSGQSNDSLYYEKALLGLKWYSGRQKITEKDFTNLLKKNRSSNTLFLESNQYKRKEQIANYVTYASAIAFAVSSINGVKPKYAYPLGGIILGSSITSSIFRKKRFKTLNKSIEVYNEN
jgi:hypothetical protein